MPELVLGGVKVTVSLPVYQGQNAVIDKRATTQPNWDRIPGLPRIYNATTLGASANIGIESTVRVECSNAHAPQLKDIQIGFLQTVQFSFRAAAYLKPQGGGAIKKFMDVITCPIKDGEGTPFYKEDYEENYLFFDDDDVAGWAGSKLVTLKMEDEPHFTFPTSMTIDKAEVHATEVSIQESFKSAFVVVRTVAGMAEHHVMYTVEWTMRGVMHKGNIVGGTCYAVDPAVEVSPALRAAAAQGFVLTGPSANKSKVVHLVDAVL